VFNLKKEGGLSMIDRRESALEKEVDMNITKCRTTMARDYFRFAVWMCILAISL